MSIPTYGVAYDFCISLTDQSNRPQFKSSPTIAAGDFKVSTAGGAYTDLTTIPDVYPAASASVRISLSAAEMTGEIINIIGKDAAGAEWDDVFVCLTPEPVARAANLTQIDGLATNGNNATLNLKMLNVINDSGIAIVSKSTASSTIGMLCEGGPGVAGVSAGGAGMKCLGGNLYSSPWGGIGLDCRAGSVSGIGLVAQSDSGGYGLYAYGSVAHIKGSLTGNIIGNIIGTVGYESSLLYVLSSSSNSVSGYIGDTGSVSTRPTDFYKGKFVTVIYSGTPGTAYYNDAGQTRLVTESSETGEITTLTVTPDWSVVPRTTNCLCQISGVAFGNIDSAVSVGSVTDPTSIWAYVVDGTRTAVQLMRGMVSALLGKSSGHAAGTPKYRNIADTKDVIDATTDVDGNRTNVNTDLS